MSKQTPAKRIELKHTPEMRTREAGVSHFRNVMQRWTTRCRPALSQQEVEALDKTATSLWVHEEHAPLVIAVMERQMADLFDRKEGTDEQERRWEREIVDCENIIEQLAVWFDPDDTLDYHSERMAAYNRLKHGEKARDADLRRPS